MSFGPLGIKGEATSPIIHQQGLPVESWPARKLAFGSDPLHFRQQGLRCLNSFLVGKDIQRVAYLELALLVA